MKPQRTPDYIRWRAKSFSYRVQKIMEDQGRKILPAQRRRWEEEAFHVYRTYGLPEDAVQRGER